MAQPYRKLALFVLILLTSLLSHGKDPYVLLISLDGFRHDYPQKFDLKFLKKLQNRSTHSNRLHPVYPTKTFPNHLSTVTGVYPDEHGIIENNFYDKKRKVEYSIGDPKAVKDPTWYKKDPIWNDLEKKGIKTASYFWPGSEALINGRQPSYVKEFNHSTANETVLKQALTWLQMPEDKRPHFMTLYFHTVDSAGHSFGPNSQKTREAAKVLDRFMERVFSEVKKVRPDINIIICSDHGMTELREEDVLLLKDIMDIKKPINITGNGTLIQLYFKTNKEAQNFFPSIKKSSQYTAYLKKDIPEKYHLKKSAHTGDIVLVANYPTFLLQRAELLKKHFIRGHHGYDSYKVEDMVGIYFEEGPDFQEPSPVKETKDIYYRMKNIFMKP